MIVELLKIVDASYEEMINDTSVPRRGHEVLAGSVLIENVFHVLCEPCVGF